MLNNGKNAILILVVLFFILPSFMINAESIATAQTNNIAQNNQQIDDVRSQSSSSKVQGSAAASIQIFFCSLDSITMLLVSSFFFQSLKGFAYTVTVNVIAQSSCWIRT